MILAARLLASIEISECDLSVIQILSLREWIYAYKLKVVCNAISHRLKGGVAGIYLVVGVVDRPTYGNQQRC